MSTCYSDRYRRYDTTHKIGLKDSGNPSGIHGKSKRHFDTLKGPAADANAASSTQTIDPTLTFEENWYLRRHDFLSLLGLVSVMRGNRLGRAGSLVARLTL